MPTYADLQSEPWWGREIVTAEMGWLCEQLCDRTDRPRTAAGTKGDNHHLNGAHRSQEWILHSRYCTDRHYTVQSGLTSTQARHVAAVDFTPGDGRQMVAQCRRIYAAMRGGRLDEVREFFGNVDGDRVVDGWDNLHDRAATSDSSHLWHWHLTIDRRHCADRTVMERILAVALGEDDDMQLGDTVHLHTGGDVAYSAKTTTVEGVLTSTNYYVLQARDRTLAELTAVRADLARLAGRDPVDAQEVVQGVLAGLGSRPAAEVAQALVAAGQDPAALAAALSALAQG